MHSTFLYFVALSAFQASVSAFSFSLNNLPTECGNVDISWTGGSPPFTMLLTPVFGTPRNISVPDSAFTNGKGAFSTTLPFEKDHRYLITMSDSTGFGSGGSTPVLSAGAPAGGTCNTKDPGVDFSYQLNTALTQCRPYIFSEYSGAIQPVSIMAIIPGGQSFVLQPPRGPTSFEWVVDVRAGNSLIFVMVDSRGRPGGSSAVLEVAPSDENSCLSTNSPSSTAISAKPTSSSTSSSPSPTTSAPIESSSSPARSGGGVPIGAILGTILGALIFLAVSITLGLFFLSRRRRERTTPWDPSTYRHNSQRMPSQANLVDTLGGGRAHSPAPYHYPSPSNPNVPPTAYPFLGHPDDPFNSPYPSASTLHLTNPSAQQDPFNTLTESRAGTEIDPFNVPAPASSHTPTTMTAAQRKAAMAGNSTYKPSRFILHTDIEDNLSEPDENEVIELPPQYSARHAAAASSTMATPAAPPATTQAQLAQSLEPEGRHGRSEPTP